MSKLRGTVRNGVIILDPPVALPDGTSVSVEVSEETSTLEWLGRFIGIWKDDDPKFNEWYREWPNSRTVSDGPVL